MESRALMACVIDASKLLPDDQILPFLQIVEKLLGATSRPDMIEGILMDYSEEKITRLAALAIYKDIMMIYGND